MKMAIARIIALIFAIALAGCGDPPMSPTQVSDKFFAQCEERKFAEAYEGATVAFRIEKSLKYFEARVRDLGFDRVKKFEWQEPQIKGDVAQRWGKITLPTGEEMTVIVTMHRDGRSWRVHEVVGVEPTGRDDVFAVRSRMSDTQDSIRFTEPVTMEVPTERLIRKMIERSLLDFNDALQAKDFTDFFATVSRRWKTRNMDQKQIDEDIGNSKNRITIPMLNTAFKNFIDAGVDLSGITKGEMTLKEPARINSDGVLLAEGEFSAAPPTPLRTIFKMEYYFEGGRWKLFGISVDMKK